MGQRWLQKHHELSQMLGKLPRQIIPMMPTIQEDLLLQEEFKQQIASTEHDTSSCEVYSNMVERFEDHDQFDETLNTLESFRDSDTSSNFESDSACEAEPSTFTCMPSIKDHNDDSNSTIILNSEFMRVFSWLQKTDGWIREPGLWGTFSYFKVDDTAFNTQDSIIFGEEAAEAYWKENGDWERAMLALSAPRRLRRKQKCAIAGCNHNAAANKLCRGHGGGKICNASHCLGAAIGGSGKCKRHGGGARCGVQGCNKSAQGAGKCKSHGGGKKCGAEGCNKAAQRLGHCAMHGGKVKCSVVGCTRTDRGGSLCEAHRAEALCQSEGCNRLAKINQLCSAHTRQQRTSGDSIRVVKL